MVSFQDKLWVYAGATDAWCSDDDGVTWNRVGPNAFPINIIGCASAVFRNQLWAIGPSPQGITCWSSPNGVTFTPHTPQFSGRYDFSALVVGETLYAVRGVDYQDPPLQEVWATADGLNWVQVGTTAPYPNLVQFGGILVDGAIVIFGGIDTYYRPYVARYLPPQLPPAA